jgi:hypothetical protein
MVMDKEKRVERYSSVEYVEFYLALETSYVYLTSDITFFTNQVRLRVCSKARVIVTLLFPVLLPLI